MKIIKHDTFPAVEGDAYTITTRDDDVGKNTAKIWAKELGAKRLHCIPQRGMLVWKVEREK